MEKLRGRDWASWSQERFKCTGRDEGRDVEVWGGGREAGVDDGNGAEREKVKCWSRF